MTGIQLYCGVGEEKFNGVTVDVGGYACISPVQGRTERTLKENRVPKAWGNTRIIQDSGAFQDSWSTRLSFEAALERQIAHATKYNYAGNIDYRVSYDLLIDECWNADGERGKRRWTVADAQKAVGITIAAAEYLAVHRHDLNLILSVQGVDAAQYLECAMPVIDCMDMTRDSLGLGGWCIIGTHPKQMMPVFRDTLRAVIPYAAEHGVTRVHIFGVIYPMALGELLWMADRHGMVVSTDSTSPANHPFRGQWGYGSWRDNSYQRVDARERGKERIRHVLLTREWLGRLSTEAEYQAPATEWTPNTRQIQNAKITRIQKRVNAIAATGQLSLPFAA